MAYAVLITSGYSAVLGTACGWEGSTQDYEVGYYRASHKCSIIAVGCRTSGRIYLASRRALIIILLFICFINFPSGEDKLTLALEDYPKCPFQRRNKLYGSLPLLVSRWRQQ